MKTFVKGQASMATYILAYKKHSLAWYYENDVTKTDEPQYMGPDNKKKPKTNQLASKS